jgi:hypothetical protein
MGMWRPQRKKKGIRRQMCGIGVVSRGREKGAREGAVDAMMDDADGEDMYA